MYQIKKIKNQRLAILVFLVFATVSLSISCAGRSARSKPFLSAEEMIDQPYGEHDKQKFDIYLPEGRSAESTPVLFVIHGGGWAYGTKSDYNYWIDIIKEDIPHMAFVSVGYRLADGKEMTNQFPAQEEDIKACVEYVMNNRLKYGISDRFVLSGASAGAHLALLQAYKHGSGSYKPAGVVSIIGPANMSNVFEQIMATDDLNKETFFNWFVDAVGGTPEEKPELCYTSSPVNYVASDSPPTLLLYGDIDPIVPRQQADELAAKLTEFGVEHTYRLYPGIGHNVSEVFTDMMKEFVDFIKKCLKLSERY